MLPAQNPTVAGKLAIPPPPRQFHRAAGATYATNSSTAADTVAWAAWHAKLSALHAHCQPNTLQQTDAGRRIHNATHAAGDFIKLYWTNMTQANKELFGHVNEFVAGGFSALNVKEHYLGMSGGCIFTADEWIHLITGGAIQNDTELREVHDSGYFPTV